MVRPSSLFRSNSQRQQPIEANANNIQQGVFCHDIKTHTVKSIFNFSMTNLKTLDSIDCGITALKCCNTPGCQKMGNKKTFTIILGFAALFQGACEANFRVSAKQAALNHDYDPQLVGEWVWVAWKWWWYIWLRSEVFATLWLIVVGALRVLNKLFRYISDWLLVASGIFQGIIAILIGYWGNRLHRTAWLGGVCFWKNQFLLLIKN